MDFCSVCCMIRIWIIKILTLISQNISKTSFNRYLLVLVTCTGLYFNEVTSIQSLCTQYSFLLFLTGEWVYINFCHRKRLRMGTGSCYTSLGKLLCILIRIIVSASLSIGLQIWDWVQVQIFKLNSCTILVTNRKKFMAHICTRNKPRLYSQSNHRLLLTIKLELQCNTLKDK